ncbi:MAG: hypothetical protein Q9M94_02400 [Candidatus Gracilibacteria bacterium]|nr:hypothetical protein [Candidatus Gracilibacteria bacterium]
MQLTQRNIDILKIIVDEYLATGQVLGSKLLLKKYDLGVSPATVRNDMATLEKLELLYQPYNSAGRLPTSKGLRVFVNFLMESTPEHFLQEKNVTNQNDFIKLGDYIHNISKELSKNTNEIAFFNIPNRHISEFSGVSSFLEKNHKIIGDDIFNIIKMLEDKFNFLSFIEKFPLNNGVNVFIGDENFLPFLKDYTIIIKKIIVDGEIGYIGIIGGLKMNYSFNISAVRGIL